jgi:4'-phosphopantetheinyl transferase EntD
VPWDVDKRKRWDSALPGLMEDAVTALRAQHVTVKTVTHDEIRALGVRVFAAAKTRDPKLQLQPIWDWGYKR